MEDFTHDCDKTLHLIPCPLCKYYWRLRAKTCGSPRDQRKCYICNVCKHCKKAHDRKLKAFFDSQQKDLNQQKPKEDSLRPTKDDLGLLREFFKSLVPHPRIVPEGDIEPVVQIIKPQGLQTGEELECDDLQRFRSNFEPYEHGSYKQGSKKTQSPGDSASTDDKKKQQNLARIKSLHGVSGSSVKEKYEKKTTKGDTSNKKEGIGGESSAKKNEQLDSAPISTRPKSPRHGKSRSKAKSPTKSAPGTHEGPLDEETKHFTSATSVPSQQQLIWNAEDSRMRLRHSRIMQNFKKGGDGVLRYVLSDRKFIDNGYTKLPTIKVMRKLNRYEMKLADPELDWFARNKSKGLLNYATGELFAKLTANHYRLFYKNGDLALDHYSGTKEKSVKYRTVVYDSDPCAPKDLTKQPAILATFDDMGNGIVYDSKGNVRLEYNQSEGVVYDKTLGNPYRWTWHNLNEPPIMKEVIVNTELPRKDAHLQSLMKTHEKVTQQEKIKKVKKALEEKRIEALEREKLSKMLREKHKDYKQFDIQMKALKLNEQFSLHINKQSAIMLRFQEGSVNLKFNVGLELQSDKYVDSEFVEVGNFMNPIERLPAQSDSLSSLQKVVLAARRAERMRKRRSPPEVNPAASMDRMNSLLSKPLQSPFGVTPGKCDGIDHPHVCFRCR